VLGIHGVDNDPDAIRVAARRNVVIDPGDAYALPYKDERFDSALMSDTIEHFKHPRKALSESHRVIRKHLYVNIPAREKFIEPDHYHSWTEQQFIDQVEACGFALAHKPILKYNLNSIYYKFKKK